MLARKKVNGREYLAVERMSGSMPQSFIGQPDALLHDFGVWLARVHARRFDGFGDLSGTRSEPKERFHERLGETMCVMVEREHAGDPAMREYLAVALEELRRLPAPEICRLMGVKGSVDIRVWMAQPELFRVHRLTRPHHADLFVPSGIVNPIVPKVR